MHNTYTFLSFTGSPPEPDIMNYTFLSNSYVKLEWSPVGTANFYLVACYLPEQNAESSPQIYHTNDTSLTVVYHEGMIVTVHSVNECSMKSSNSTSTTINMSEASKYDHRPS